MFSNFQTQAPAPGSHPDLVPPITTGSQTLNPLPLFLIIQNLYNANVRLTFEVQQLKQSLEKAKNEKEAKQRQESGNEGEGRVSQAIAVRKVPKIFKKDKKCPIEGCQRRYSSKIAVNAHIRKHHLKQSRKDGSER